MKTSLVTRNVRIEGRRTSVRLEPPLWRSLEMIAAREETDVNALCTEVEKRRGPEGGFTSALRVFIVDYLRALAFPDAARSVGLAKAGKALPVKGAAAAGKKTAGKTAPVASLAKSKAGKTPVAKAPRKGAAAEPAMAAAAKRAARKADDAPLTGRRKTKTAAGKAPRVKRSESARV